MTWIYFNGNLICLTLVPLKCVIILKYCLETLCHRSNNVMNNKEGMVGINIRPNQNYSNNEE